MNIRRRKTAFMFPGQGSQHLKIMRGLADYFSEIKRAFYEASEVLGYDVWYLAQHGPLERINQTAYTQPLLLTAEVALWRLWKSQGGQDPDFFVGHSLGEYAAHVCANNVSFQDALRLVSMRGLFMQEAVQNIECAMSVIIGLSYEEISDICEKAQEGQTVAISCYNTPEQIIIAGHLSSVRRAMKLAKQAGACVAKRLPISVPAHCELMQTAKERLQLKMDRVDFTVNEIPVLSNAYRIAIETADDLKKSLLTQMCNPVLWVAHIEQLQEARVKRFIECGPGHVLTHLTQTMVSDESDVLSISNYIDLKKALHQESSLSDFG